MLGSIQNPFMAKRAAAAAAAASTSFEIPSSSSMNSTASPAAPTATAAALHSMHTHHAQLSTSKVNLREQLAAGGSAASVMPTGSATSATTKGSQTRRFMTELKIIKPGTPVTDDFIYDAITKDTLMKVGVVVVVGAVCLVAVI